MRQWVLHGSGGCYLEPMGPSEEPVKGQVSDTMLANLSPCPATGLLVTLAPQVYPTCPFYI